MKNENWGDFGRIDKRLCFATAMVALEVGLLISPAYAQQKTYTPAQLRNMVEKGMPPKQGSPTTQTKDMDYATCIESIMSVVNSVKPNYPTRTVLSTNIARIEKVWTNDSAMTLSCSAPDRKLVITTSPYL